MPRSRKACSALLKDPDHFEEVFAEEVQALRDEQEVDEALEQQTGAKDREGSASLRHRILEVRRQEQAHTASELLHLHVFHRFQQLGISPMPSLAANGSAVALAQVDPKRLVVGIYSQDALKLVGDHVMDIIGEWAHLVRDFPLQLSVFQAGQVYAMSALFGYSLRRVDARYQLEQLAAASNEHGDGLAVAGSLAAYVAGFGPEEARQVAALASQEAEGALGRQVAALFGDLQALQEELLRALGPPTEAAGAGAALGRQQAPCGEAARERLRRAIEGGEVASLRLTVSDLRRLALEGCAFGFLLGAAEARVDSTYELTPGTGHSPVALVGGSVDEGLKFSAFRIFGT